MSTPSQQAEAARARWADPEQRRRQSERAREQHHSTNAIVNRVVARVGELTDEQISRLRRLLPPVPTDDATTDDRGAA